MNPDSCIQKNVKHEQLIITINNNIRFIISMWSVLAIADYVSIDYCIITDLSICLLAIMFV